MFCSAIKPTNIIKKHYAIQIEQLSCGAGIARNGLLQKKIITTKVMKDVQFFLHPMLEDIFAEESLKETTSIHQLISLELISNIPMQLGWGVVFFAAWVPGHRHFPQFQRKGLLEVWVLDKKQLQHDTNWSRLQAAGYWIPPKGVSNGNLDIQNVNVGLSEWFLFQRKTHPKSFKQNLGVGKKGIYYTSPTNWTRLTMCGGARLAPNGSNFNQFCWIKKST